MTELLQNPRLLRLDFDQFQRYGALALLLKPLLAERGRPARILEVGCNTLNLLAEFLYPHVIELTRCDVADVGQAAADFVQIEKDRPLPFADERFDYVVALEVLEHIPAEDRLFALGEWARVARHGLFVSCPNGGPAVKRAEARAARAYEQRNGAPHPFLSEHAEFSPPSGEAIAKLLDALGLFWARLENSPLAEWLPLLLLTEELSECAGPWALEQFNRWMNAGRVPFARAGEMYRQVLVAFRTDAELRRARGLWRLPEAAAETESVEPIVAVTRRLRELLLARFPSWLDGRTPTAPARQEMVRPSEIEARLAHLERQLCLCRLERDSERRGTPSSAPPQLPVDAELRQLRYDAASGLWEALGDSPQICWEQPLRAGWARITVGGQLSDGGFTRLYFDDGHGFEENRCVLLGPWDGPVNRSSLHIFHAPVRAWRYDPSNAAGPFRLTHLDIQPVGKAAVAWHAARAYLRTLASPREALRMLARFARALWREGKAGVRAELLRPLLEADARRLLPEPAPLYSEWLAAQSLSPEQRAGLIQRASAAGAPRLAVVLAVLKLDPASLRRTLAALDGQAYPALELHIGVVASAFRGVKRLAGEFPSLKACVRFVPLEPPGRASDLLNDVLEHSPSTRADYLLPIDPGDELTPDALWQLADALQQRPDVDFVYSDEAHWTAKDGYVGPHCKPDWSPEAFVSRPYSGRLAAYRAERCRELGGFATWCLDGHEYEMILRLAAPTGANVFHLPQILCHRPVFPPPAPVTPESLLRVLSQRGTKEPGRAPLDASRSTPERGPRFHVPTTDLVSIVIPTAGRSASIRGRASYFVRNCVESIRRETSYPRYEILVVDNGDLDPELRDVFDDLEVRRFSFTEPFNLAAKLNLGAVEAKGQQIVLLNDDTEVITRDWLEALLEYASRPEIGAAGAKLLFPDGRIQHVGVLLLEAGPSHPWYLAAGSHEGHFWSTAFPRNFLAVTGACLMTRRELFLELGGFDRRFPVNYNDVDYCLRLQERGLRVVYTPHAELHHFEAVSKEGGATVRPEELALFRQLWAERYPVDPFYNPNLSLRHCDYRLRSLAAPEAS